MKLVRYPIIILSILIFQAAGAQESRKEQIRSEQQRIEEEIRYTNKLLERTRETRKASLDEVSMIDSKISKREELISTYHSQVRYLDQQIRQNEDSILILSGDLERLKDEYARMIYYAYKNKNLYNRLMFIFAAEDFNQAYQRLKYFQQYNAYRKKQAELIGKTREEITRRISQLEDDRKEKRGLLLSVEGEKENLARERSVKSQTVQELGRKERDLKKALKEKQAAAEKLRNALEAIIAEEIRKAREREKAEAGPRDVFALTPKEMALSSEFENNRGKLPWPLERAVISSTFGEHPHPVLDKVKIKNNGVDLLTEEGARARAIFGGTVTRVLSVPNNNNVVIIRHGQYLSVYSNLDEVLVSQGDEIRTLQPIGVVFTNPDEKKTELHFEIWQSKNLQNPSDWLSRP